MREKRAVIGAVALPSTRMEFRVTLSHVDRGIALESAVVVALHPSETLEHLCLRVLAWCLFHEERLEHGPGLCEPDAADLWARDLTGRLTTWIECGDAQADKLRRVAHQHSDAQVLLVTDDARRAAELARELSGRGPKRRGAVSLWLLDGALVAELARDASRRRAWTVTIADDHLYVDAGGRTVDGPLARVPLAGG
jgi:uncharacterized protein YaeQ